MAMKIRTRAILYQISMVLNLSLSEAFLLATDDPTVIRTIENSIRKIWIMPKNNRSKDALAVLKFFQKYLIIGLWEHKTMPNTI